MNKQGPGKIEYLDYVWNPVQGCKKNCPFCYVPRNAIRFGIPKGVERTPERIEQVRRKAMEPRWNQREFDSKFPKKPSRIGVCFTGDLFGKWIDRSWILCVLERIEAAPEHQFIVLTRNPARYAEFELPANLWTGVSVSDLENESLVFLNARIDRFLAVVPPDRRILSLEPLTTTYFDESWSAPMLVEGWMRSMDWVLIGGLTGKGAQPTERDELHSLVNYRQRKYARGQGPAMFVKKNAVADPNDELLVQKYPRGLQI